MALRVLLADNSDSIKKVIQLSLQDFGLELKTVQYGIDVLEVATQFKPDIILADILLQKKNGYDVSLELKSSQLSAVPIILMWSGFIDFDENRYRESKANARLEKPFDAEKLRNLVKQLLPNLNQNELSDFLEFPEMPQDVTVLKNQPQTAEESVAPPSIETPSLTPPPPPASSDAAAWNMDSFDNIENFATQSIPIPSQSTSAQPARMDLPDLELVDPGNDDFERKALSNSQAHQVPGLPEVPPTTFVTQEPPPPAETFTSFSIQALPTIPVPEPVLPPNSPLMGEIPLEEAVAPSNLEIEKLEIEKIELQDTLTHADEDEDAEIPPSFSLAEGSDSDSDWVQQDLTKIQVDFAEAEIDLDNFAEVQIEKIQKPKSKGVIEQSVSSSNGMDSGDAFESPIDESLFVHQDPLEHQHQAESPLLSKKLNETELETVLRNQSQEIIEKVVWKIVPEIASQLIRDELKRLLDEKNNPPPA